MSVNMFYIPCSEPYYDFFIKHGYSYIGHGYMHIVFEKDGIVYKVMRSAFGKDKDKNRFKFESDMLNFVSRHGIPTPPVVHIYGPDELIPDYCVLAEKKISGYVHSSEELNMNMVLAIQSVLKTTYNISFHIHIKMKSGGFTNLFANFLCINCRNIIRRMTNI